MSAPRPDPPPLPDAAPPGVDRPRLDDIIRYESEQTGVDFKQAQYHQRQHEALVKDVLALANADASGDRFIICGVHAPPGLRRAYPGVPERPFPDAATYQQLVADNIEPALHLDYFPYVVDGVLFAVFRISGCTERPYAMRKKLGLLEHGHLWIRKGTTQMVLRREDLERIYEQRYAAGRFTGTVRIGFAAPGNPTTLTVSAASEIVLPSDRAARKIRRILQARAEERQRREHLAPGLAAELARSEELQQLLITPSYGIGFARPVPYKDRNDETLRKDLERVKRTYEIQDEYEFVELYSHKLNVALYNDGTEHVEAARLELEIPAIPGLSIATEPVGEPWHDLDGVKRGLTFHRPGERGYPRVRRRDDGSVHVADDLGDVRHQTRTPAFAVPLRIVLGPEAVDATVPMVATLHGKNLRQPITTTLALVVAPPDGRLPVAGPDA